jgi:small neutral amino acid transporter SnatA (MarC family)
MSNEYLLAVVLILGGVLKVFGIEIENSALEGIIGGAIALWIAIKRYKRGDITLGGLRK